MEARKPKRLSREDWIHGALDLLQEVGVKGVKVVVLADRLGVTSGSFYWHFNKLDDLLNAVLEHWEYRLTEHIIKDAQAFDGPADQRILNLMTQVIREGASEYDHAVSIWARTTTFPAARCPCSALWHHKTGQI